MREYWYELRSEDPLEPERHYPAEYIPAPPPVTGWRRVAIAGMDSITAATNRVVRWLDKS